jgi:hypothetical protein
MSTASKFTLIVLFLSAAVPSQAQNWVDITPAAGPAPSARMLQSAILDPTTRKMIIFAGEDATSRLNDIWQFDVDTHTWTDLTPGTGPAPALRRTPVSIFDPSGPRMVTWSGQGTSGFFNDAWEFDLISNTWSQYSPTGGPPNIRYGAAGVFDPVSGDLVTFAGFTNMGRFDDTWRLNPAGTTWSDVTPGTAPLERCLHSASYDAGQHRMIMYGGQNNGARNDIWAFDLTLNTWTELTPAVSPDGRWFTAHTYDAANHRVMIFGGNTGTVISSEVWAFDLATNTWFMMNPSGTGPTHRAGATAVYDGANDRMVVFGGKGAEFYNEVWSLENLSGSPTAAEARLPENGPRLGQNYPNPFNPSTVIGYEISTPGFVSLRIYDVRGKLVRTLVDENRAAGPHEVTWNGRTGTGAAVASGNYYYRLETAGEILVRRMVLLK